MVFLLVVHEDEDYVVQAARTIETFGFVVEEKLIRIDVEKAKGGTVIQPYPRWSGTIFKVGFMQCDLILPHYR